MQHEYLLILGRVVAALVAGGMVGFERSYHGRPAGFRTHTLVCISSSLLTLLTAYEWQWLPMTLETVRIDPTRMAQGIMTGIGFLGAGVIIKEGMTVRGLTTAASIWTTAALGILAGAGFYFPLVLGVIFTLGTLSLFRLIEARIPAQYYARYSVRFPRADVMSEPQLRQLVAEHGFRISDLSYHLNAREDYFEYGMIISTQSRRNLQRLSETLNRNQSVREFRISPAGD